MKDVEQDRRLKRRLEQYRTKLEENIPGNLPRDVDAVLREIHEQPFDMDLNVESILDSCGIRSNTIFSRFKNYVGIPPKQYLEQIRIGAAIEVLPEECFAIGNISFMIGYENCRTFERAFRRNVGCSPSMYRASILHSA